MKTNWTSVLFHKQEVGLCVPINKIITIDAMLGGVLPFEELLFQGLKEYLKDILFMDLSHSSYY